MARLLEREDFTKRMKADQPISSLELFYPVLQGYDSVAVRSDVELGGTDQKFNLLFARDIQRAYDVPEQSIMTMPILPGIDGGAEDEQVARQLRRGDRPAGGDVRQADERSRTRPWAPTTSCCSGESVPEGHPMAAKRALARRIVERFHGKKAAEEAEAHFNRLHVEHGLPDEMPETRSLERSGAPLRG